MIEKIIEIFLRIFFASLAIFGGYLIVNQIIQPDLNKLCLTDTNGCFYLKMYKYKNSFIAQESTTGLWIWFNGLYLYVYGIAPGNCRQKQNYEPVFKMEIDTSKGFPQFFTDRIQCVTKREQVLDYYKTVYKVKEQIVYIRPDKASVTFQEILTELYNKKLIA
jgi:hypothetical protein